MFLLWLFSIAFGIASCIGLGYLIYWISDVWLKLKYTKDSGIHILAGFILAIFCGFVILFSTLDGCFSQYKTFDESLSEFAFPYYFILIFALLILAPLSIYIYGKYIDYKHIKKYGKTKAEYEDYEEKQHLEEINNRNLRIEENKKNLNSLISVLGGEVNNIECFNKEDLPIRLIFCKNDKIIISSEALSDTYSVLYTIRFKDILNYNTNQESYTTPLTSTTTTKTNTGNMLGRGIVGGLAFGGLGAAAGAITAKKSSATEYSGGVTLHSYRINVSINSLVNPSLVLKFNYNNDEFNKAIGCFNFILNKNRQNS